MMSLSNIKKTVFERIDKIAPWFDFSSPDRDEHHYVRLGWHLLLWGFGGFLLWACIAPIDQGVSASGWIITTSNRQAIQPANAGIVDEILVREGETVKAGQVLVKLNPITAQADNIALKENASGLQAQIKGLEESISHKQKQIKSLSQQVQATQDLVNEGYYAKNRALELERQYLQLKASLSDDQGNLTRLNNQVAEQNAKITATEFSLANTELKSPVNGQVVNLTIFTKGGVVSPGAKLMEIIPLNESLIVEGQLPVHLVDKARAGESVELMFTAFNQNRTPHIPATLQSVGADRIVDERTGAPYYKVLALVTPKGMAMLESLKLKVQPGMPVEMFIKTGERTMMSYLLKPILDRSHSALREE